MATLNHLEQSMIELDEAKVLHGAEIKWQRSMLRQHGHPPTSSRITVSLLTTPTVSISAYVRQRSTDAGTGQ